MTYAVDYYFINYTAHFFALILPCKVQYTVVWQCLCAQEFGLLNNGRLISATISPTSMLT